MFIPRPNYEKQLLEFLHAPMIKVITGIRRSGKSALIEMLRISLLEKHVAPERIIAINFEDLAYISINDAQMLHSYILERIKTDEIHYILLDEIQEVSGWERAINSLLATRNVDIYITGSNSTLLSSELSTYIAGRYIEIKVLPLSFLEYLSFRASSSNDQIPRDRFRDELLRYIRLGGFPVIHLGEFSDETAYKILYDIYSSALLRDAVQRHNIRQVELLERVVKFVLDNIGRTFSAKAVADYFKSQQRSVDINTIYNYLSALESAFIVKKVSRYDLKGKELLKTQEKYYIGDHGLVHANFGYRGDSIGAFLENIVYLELLRRGFRVNIGKVEQYEIDFVAQRRQERMYIQVCYLLADNQKTKEREYRPLQMVHDAYPKLVISMDELTLPPVDGIRHMSMVEFLTEEY